jgi:hypothetical protein
MQKAARQFQPAAHSARISAGYIFTAPLEINKLQHFRYSFFSLVGRYTSVLVAYLNIGVHLFQPISVIATSETQAPMCFVSLITPPPEAESFIGQILSRFLGK